MFHLSRLILIPPGGIEFAPLDRGFLPSLQSPGTQNMATRGQLPEHYLMHVLAKHDLILIVYGLVVDFGFRLTGSVSTVTHTYV